MLLAGAGDFLYPSRLYDGEQVIDVMNLLDGAPGTEPVPLAGQQHRLRGRRVRKQPPGCLEEGLGHAGVRLMAEESEIRRFETDFLHLQLRSRDTEPRFGQEGVSMLTPDRLVPVARKVPNLRDLVIQGLAKAEPEGIAPMLEGRICNSLRPGPCLAVAR